MAKARNTVSPPLRHLPRARKASAVETQIIELIRNGVYNPGDALPPMRQLALQFNVHYNTTQTIIARLEQEGWVTAIDRKGVFVARVLPDINMVRRHNRRDNGIWMQRFGIVCSDLEIIRQATTDFEVIGAIESAAAESEVRVVHYPLGLHVTAEECDALVARMRDAGLEGLIIVGLRETQPLEQFLTSLRDWDVPTILCPLGRLTLSTAFRVPIVDYNNTLAGTIAAEHLVKFGHRELALVTYDHQRNYIDERITGYAEVCRANGLIASSTRVLRRKLKAMTAEEQFNVGKAAYAELPKTVTGVVCMNDRVAAGLIEAAEQAGKRIGIDLSVVGHDNDRDWWHKEISTVIPPTHHLGRRAWERLNDVHGHANASVFENIIVPSRLLWRQSSGPRMLDQ